MQVSHRKAALYVGVALALMSALEIASHAANPPLCPHVIGWNSQITTWAQGAPWIKVIYSLDVAPAKAVGAKVFYRPWDADPNNHDDACLPASLTGTQYADLVWAKLTAMNPKPDAVGYRNEFNWTDPACSKRTCAEFVNYAGRLRALGYTGKIIFGSFGVGWVDSGIWDDPDLTNAVNASDGIETHEYFDLTITCGAPWLAFRHRDIALANHAYLQGKDWYIGEFGSDRCICDDSQQRRGWRDNNKLTEQAYIDQMKAYRSGCANQVVAVFVFQQGDSYNWSDFETMGTSVADYMKTTWKPCGRLTGSVRNASSLVGIAGATVVTSPGGYTTKTNSSGVFIIETVPIGKYSVTGVASGYAPTTVANRSVFENQSTSATIFVSPATPINAAKGLADNGSAAVDGIVTAQFPVGGSQDRIYLEGPSRSSGIAVATTTSFTPGDEVVASGTMTTVDGERVLNATSAYAVQTGGTIPKRIGFTNRALGGGRFGLQSAVLNNSATGELAQGLNNTGLLVSTWGEVSSVDPGGAYFYIDDGSGIMDGSGQNGVRVACLGLASPTAGANVVVTGISGVRDEGGKTTRLLRPRSFGDLSYATDANYVSNPGFEVGMLTNWTQYGSVDGIQSGSWFGNVTAHSGAYFLGAAANWGTKSGGVYQRVPAMIGSRYQARVWSRVYRESNPTDSVQNRVGIDPTGGTAPNSGTISWSPVDMQATEGSSLWRELASPTVTCTTGYVTIFLDGQQINTAGWHINCFDDAGVYRQ